MIRIIKVSNDKKRFLPLLLLNGHQEADIDQYLEDSEMFILLNEGKLRTIAVVSKEPKRVFEIKNLATEPAYQRQGFGRQMMNHLLAYYHGKGRLLLACVAADSIGAQFYAACGLMLGKTNGDMVYMMREL